MVNGKFQTYFLYKKDCCTYSCLHCRAHLARQENLISKSFHGSQGRAYLFKQVVNIRSAEAKQRVLLTGLHFVADIYCACCDTKLGWKYERAFELSQRYKEGKFIIELAHLVKNNSWDSEWFYPLLYRQTELGFLPQSLCFPTPSSLSSSCSSKDSSLSIGDNKENINRRKDYKICKTSHSSLINPFNLISDDYKTFVSQDELAVDGQRLPVTDVLKLSLTSSTNKTNDEFCTPFITTQSLSPLLRTLSSSSSLMLLPISEALYGTKASTKLPFNKNIDFGNFDSGLFNSIQTILRSSNNNGYTRLVGDRNVTKYNHNLLMIGESSTSQPDKNSKINIPNIHKSIANNLTRINRNRLYYKRRASSVSPIRTILITDDSDDDSINY